MSQSMYMYLETPTLPPFNLEYENPYVPTESY